MMNHVNYKLKAARIQRELKQKDMLAILNLKSLAAYSQKECGKRPFTKDEIQKISDYFVLSGDEIKNIFFTNDVNANSNLNIDK